MDYIYFEPLYEDINDQYGLVVKIDWSKPFTHDMLFDDIIDDDDAYFYSIIAIDEGDWWPYYIGKVYSQSVSERHKNLDHRKKLDNLKNKYPNKVFHLTIGTPIWPTNIKRVNKKLVETIEGLLIYSNWHNDILNKVKINNFYSDKFILIKNEGFVKPFDNEIAYGIFKRDY